MVTLPAAATTFMADLFFLSQLQLRVVHDLSVLYRQPGDLDDPEDLLALIRIAFGIKAGERLQNAVLKLAPEATRFVIKRGVTGATLQTLKALPVVGRYLLQRNIIKMAIPGVAVPHEPAAIS